MKKFLRKYIFSPVLTISIVGLLLLCIKQWGTFHIATKVLLPYSIGCLVVLLCDAIKNK